MPRETHNNNTLKSLKDITKTSYFHFAVLRISFDVFLNYTFSLSHSLTPPLHLISFHLHLGSSSLTHNSSLYHRHTTLSKQSSSPGCRWIPTLVYQVKIFWCAGVLRGSRSCYMWPSLFPDFPFAVIWYYRPARRQRDSFGVSLVRRICKQHRDQFAPSVMNIDPEGAERQRGS